MYILLTFVLLLFSMAGVVALRLARPGTAYSWLPAAVGTLLAWLSVLLWQFSLPWQFLAAPWMLVEFFGESPRLLVDQYTWIYAFSLTALAVAVVLTAPARSSQTRPPSLVGTLSLTFLGLLAVMADNPLALALAWVAVDLAEFLAVIHTKPSLVLVRRALFSLAVGAVGVGLVMWAGVLGVASNGDVFSLDAVPAQAGLALFAAVIVRLSVWPLRLAFHPRELSSTRRGFGTLIRIVAVSANLAALSHLPVGALDPNWLLFALLVTGVAALYAGWRWFLSADELEGRPYWLIGLGALSLAAFLRGSPTGSVVWGVALILFSGLSFLYSAKQRWLTRGLTFLGLLLLALPYTLTSLGWQGEFPFGLVLWPLFILAHILLALGYFRHLLRPVETDLAQLPSWAQAAYPVGMLVLALSLILGSLWGWPGAFNPGDWRLGLAVLGLFGAAAFILWRWPRLIPAQPRTGSGFGPAWLLFILGIVPRPFSFFYRLAGQLAMYVSSLLEGDGGLLWTVLLLILLGIYLRGR